MASDNEKLEKVTFLNNKNIDLVYKKFTGKVIIHWKDGEPMEEEVISKKKIKLE